MLPKSVGIVYSDDYCSMSSRSPKFGNRFAMVMSLINAYGLIKHLQCIKPVTSASNNLWLETLKTFHSTEYIEALMKLQQLHEASTDTELDDSSFDDFGLTYDCPGFPHVFDYSLAAVRGSLAGATALLQSQCQVAINWAGGWHHAKREEASGFCYLNDIVLAIQKILSSIPISDPITGEINRILYLDFDLHHGDGVEEAFWYSSRVVTFSVHHASQGFFPGTGTWYENDPESGVFHCGAGRGRYSAFNLPLDEGTNDSLWWCAVSPVLDMLHKLVKPAYVVVQFGADGLVSDPHRVFRLTNACVSPENPYGNETSGYLNAVKRILSWNLPTLILGGGGYNFPDTARLWTRITALVIEEVKGHKIHLDDEIPEHAYFECYGPGFDLNISPSLLKTSNSALHNIVQHHQRLLQQAHDYALCNGLNFNCTQMESLRNSAD